MVKSEKIFKKHITLKIAMWYTTFLQNYKHVLHYALCPRPGWEPWLCHLDTKSVGRAAGVGKVTTHVHS